MSAQNLTVGKWTRSQGTYVTGSSTITGSQAVLHSILVGSYTPGGRFRVANGTATNIVSYLTGTFVPQATGIQPPTDFEELEFANGIYVETTGGVELTVIYNTLV